MNTTSDSSYDPAPLQWVSGEIELSLAKVRENLDLIGASPGDANAIQSVTADLHQVTGALLMVGLEAAARLNEEIEKLVETLKDCSPVDVATRVQIARHSTEILSKYLEGLVAGNADRPMELAAPYVMLNKARGADDASASDLFSPDLHAADPHLVQDGESPSEDSPVEAISRCRGIFQAGVLKLVRDKDLAGGALHMCDAVLALEALDATLSSRAFWFTAVGFLEAVANDPTGAGTLAVKLFGKIDQQIKRLMADDHEVPEKLFRDLLLVIGRSAARTERIDQIREIYQLDELLSLPSSHTQNKSVKKLTPVIESLRSQLKGMKEELQQFAGGNTSALEPLIKLSAALATIGQQLPNREMVRLLQLLGAVGRHLGKTGKRPTEIQALEVATALLFVESSLGDFFKLTEDFDQQASSICTRIQGVMTGVELPGFNRSVASLSDTMTLQAQTHLLVFQVGREVRANLAMIESVLDDFFRDAAKVEGLSIAPNLFKQVRGAFSILEESEAAALANSLAERVAQFAGGEVMGVGEDARAVAEGISALGLFVEGLQRGSPDAGDILTPSLIALGIAKEPAPVKKVAAIKPVAKIVAKTIAKPVAKPEKKPAREADAQRQAEGVPAPPQEGVAVSIASPIAPVAPPVSHPAAAPSEMERLIRSDTELRTKLAERDQRIRLLQTQLVALHREARTVAALKEELTQLRALLAKVEKKAH